jgi:predicted enzyme related to lactoylglutathione lyase
MSPSATAAAAKFVWYSLLTPDSTQAETFYRGVLGWVPQDSGLADRSYKVMSAGDGAVTGLVERPAASFTSDSRPAWIGYVGVNSVDDFAKRVEQAGGAIHRRPEDIPNVGRFAVVADPQGALFALFQAPAGMQQPPAAKPGTPGIVSWHELSSNDWKSEFDFYNGLFGWTKAQEIDMGPHGVYAIFATGAEPVGGMMNRMDERQPIAWLFYFNVEEINAAISRVKQHGGTILHGPAPVPGGAQIALCLDPQGAAFGMVGPPSAQ